MIAAGTTNAKVLALEVTTKIKRKEEAEKALTNTLTTEHIFVIKQLMDQFHYLEKKIKDVESELAEKARPYAHLIEKLDEIPGIDKIHAMGILAEATNQMEKFKDERSFAAWAGVAAGNNESAGKKKDQSAGKVTRT